MLINISDISNGITTKSATFIKMGLGILEIHGREKLPKISTETVCLLKHPVCITLISVTLVSGNLKANIQNFTETTETSCSLLILRKTLAMTSKMMKMKSLMYAGTFKEMFTFCLLMPGIKVQFYKHLK